MAKEITHSPKILENQKNGSELDLDSDCLQEILLMIEDLPRQSGTAAAEHQERMKDISLQETARSTVT